MNPIEMLFSWQALLVAAACTGITQLVKTIVDLAWGHQALKSEKTGSPASAKLSAGRESRRRAEIFNRIVFPITPIVVGMIFAAVVPLHPEVIDSYIEEHGIDGWTHYLVYIAWGAACGQFADYLWTKAKDALGAVLKKSPPEDGSEG